MIGDEWGLPIPAHPDALRAAGTGFLTAAFHASGTLVADNSVAEMTSATEVRGGSTGRKMALSVRYARPDPQLHTNLFVKFSRDFDDPVRDRGRTQMEAEVHFAQLASIPNFPVTVPFTMHGDYHRDSGTGILITERIAFGHNGIEPQHHKCVDYEMPDQIGHYRALITALARLAGTSRSGRLPADVVERFPIDLQAASVGERSTVPPERLRRKLVRLAEFVTTHPGLFDASIRGKRFVEGLPADGMLISGAEREVWRRLRRADDHIALCHWNANVDNAWFWRDAGALQCGLMDWGCVSRINVAMALWGAMSAAETDLWDDHLDDLLTLFAKTFHDAGGPDLGVDEMRMQLMSYVAIMGVAWLLDVPALMRSRIGEDTRDVTRHDPRVRADEGVRAPLQMLTNVLNLWESNQFGELFRDSYK